MGAGLSSPVDEQQMKDIAQKILGDFSAKYGKTYSVALLKKVIEDAKGGDGGNDYELLSRPAESKSKDPIKTGWMTKEGAVVKNWKKRFFVVRHDYKIEYYDKEETYKSGGNPKGIINPAGYTVEAEPEKTLLKRVEDLAAKIKVDVSSLSKPKSLPPNTLGLLHERRRDWYIQFESEAQKQEWVPVLKDCCKKAEGLNTQDSVAKDAYKKAFAKTREACGYYDYWNFNGSEEQNLSDLIVRELNSKVLQSFYDSIEEKVANAKMRSMVVDKIEDGIASTVNTIVSTGWSAASRAVESVRGPIESKLKQNVDKLVEAQKAAADKMVDLVSSIVDPIVSRIAKPFASVVVPIVVTPTERALKELIAVFDAKSEEAVKSISSGQDENQVWRDLARLPWLWGTLKDAREKLDGFKELLEKADAFEEIKFGVDTLEDLISSALGALQGLLDRAFYTLQHTFGKKTKEGKDKTAAVEEARSEAREKLLHDCKVTVVSLLKDQLGNIALGPVKKNVIEPCSGAIAPFSDAIPEVLKDVVNPDDTLDDTVTTIVKNAVAVTVDPAVPSFA